MDVDDTCLVVWLPLSLACRPRRARPAHACCGRSLYRGGYRGNAPYKDEPPCPQRLPISLDGDRGALHQHQQPSPPGCRTMPAHACPATHFHCLPPAPPPTTPYCLRPCGPAWPAAPRLAALRGAARSTSTCLSIQRTRDTRAHALRCALPHTTTCCPYATISGRRCDNLRTVRFCRPQVLPPSPAPPPAVRIFAGDCPWLHADNCVSPTHRTTCIRALLPHGTRMAGTGYQQP